MPQAEGESKESGKGLARIRGHTNDCLEKTLARGQRGLDTPLRGVSHGGKVRIAERGGVSTDRLTSSSPSLNGNLLASFQISSFLITQTTSMDSEGVRRNAHGKNDWHHKLVSRRPGNMVLKLVQSTSKPPSSTRICSPSGFYDTN